jgi:predicted nucleic acid-binding protein
MMQSKSFAKIPGATYAISNTGPLISAFQSDSFELITKIFPTVFISTVCMAELEDHGWKDEIQAASPQLVVMKLTVKEKKRALIFARQISQHPDTNDPVIENHLGESQAIVLALRSEHKNDLLLLDELAARSIAKQAGIKLSGFPGILLLATQARLISAEDMKKRLELCRVKGTHYGVKFIKQVYEMAKR